MSGIEMDVKWTILYKAAAEHFRFLTGDTLKNELESPSSESLKGLKRVAD